MAAGKVKSRVSNKIITVVGMGMSPEDLTSLLEGKGILNTFPNYLHRKFLFLRILKKF
jgi:hypothetical protein